PAVGIAPTGAGVDGELVSLGRELEARRRALGNALERRRSARALCESLCPPLPGELAWRHGEPRPLAFAGNLGDRYEYETDVEGKAVVPPLIKIDGRTYARHPTRVLRAHWLRDELSLHDDLRFKEARTLKQKLACAE